MKSAVGIVVSCCLVVPAAAWAEKDKVYALVGARIVTVSGPTLDSGTLVLRDGVIEAVGGNVTVPADARIVDAKGLTLTPGLIDAFGGVGLPAPRRGGEPGGGGGRMGGGGGGGASEEKPLAPQTLALDHIKASEAVKARDAGVTTALVISKDGVLPGRSVLLDLAGDKPEEMVLKQPAALHLHMNRLSRQYPGSLMGTMAYARQALYDATRYREEWAAYEKAPRGKKRPQYDPALEAWQAVVDGRLPLVITAYRENDVRRALALADEFKLKVVVAGATQAFRVASLVKARKLPLLVTVNFDPPKAARNFGGEDEEKEKREIEEAEKNPAELAKAGVSFALVSGHAQDFVAGIRKAIERGLPRETALRSVTLQAAEALGIADRTGSLEAGKLGNVVAWTAEPLTKDAKAKLVFVDGKLFEPEEKERDKDKDKKKDDKAEEKPTEEVTR
jgi:imidazolonepropionase-like amidohydrolase